MADLSDFEGAEAGIVRQAPPTATFNFKPGAEIGEATFVADPDEEPQGALDRWAAHLLGVDVGTMQILEVLEVRAWGFNPETGAPYRYVKAAVTKVKDTDRAAQEAAKRWIEQHPRRPRKGKQAPKKGVHCAEWRPIADTQLGKGGEERFGGIGEAMARMDWAAEAYTQWHDERRKLGYAPQRIIIPLAGDLTEGVCGSYDNQEFVTSLNAADQLELAITAVERQIEAAVDAVGEVIVTGVASNHDRQSRVGKRENITDAWDDRTFVLMRTLARVHARVPRGTVRFVMPNNPHVAVLNDEFLTVATIHGHKPKWVRNVQDTMWTWWGQEIANRRDAAAAQVLLAGHYHHAYTLGPQSGRLLIGLPSLDGGSAWFEATGGDWSLPGIRPFLTTHEGVRELATLVWQHDRAAAEQHAGSAIA